MASAASGEASPRAFMSFLLSSWIAPEESIILRGLTKSDLSCRSSFMAAVFSHSRMAPQISARLFFHATGFLAFQPKFTPRTLYFCSVKRSRMPYPSPPSSITVRVGRKSSIASITRPTIAIVSSPEYRRIATKSRPLRTAITVESSPPRAGSTPMTTAAFSSL